MILFNLLLALTVSGQLISSVSPVTGEQNPSVDSLRIIEKVYIHTDRSCYFPGDDIWFKAYLIDAADRLLSGNSNNLHVELISPSSEIIINRIIRLDSGLGNGDFKLPGNLESGRYRIRAYTNYMRNFGNQLFFNKEISVISSADAKNAFSDSTNYIMNKLAVSFFPEGGSLVENVSSLVAFKAVDAVGKGCDVSGQLYSSSGDLITTFKSDYLGMGSFFLRPVTGSGYYSIVKDISGSEIKAELPKSFPTGITLSASTNEDDELVISICTNSKTLPDMLDQPLFLTFSAREVPLKTINFKIKTYNNSFVLPTDDLPDGIVMITLATIEDFPLSERLIYIQRDQDFRVSIEPGKQIYNKRDSVTIRISSSAEYDFSQEAFLSLSAADKSYTDNSSQYPTTISSWFLLESDIRGPVEEPSYYFDPSNPGRFHDLDLLLLTQGWRDFEWKYDSTSYFAPESGFTVSGRLRKLNVNKPLADARVNIGIFDMKGSIITSTEADSSGGFRLDDINLTGKASLVVTAVNEKGNPQNCLILLDSLKYKYAEVTDNFSRIILFPEEKVTTYIQEYEIKEAIRKKYKLSDTINIGEVTIIAKKSKDIQTIKVENIRLQYGKPDDEVIITKREAGYQNVLEVLKDRVPGVKIISNSEATGIPYYQIWIRGVNSITSGTRPLILIDGVKTNDPRLWDVLSLPVGFIDRIDILKSAGETGAFGALGGTGVISIITKTGDNLPHSRPANYSVSTKIKGYDAARVFYSPQHLPSAPSTYEPDLRTTLFWEPDIRLQPDKSLLVKYFNGDNSSTVRVIVEGITTKGIPITASTEYKIK